MAYRNVDENQKEQLRNINYRSSTGWFTGGAWGNHVFLYKENKVCFAFRRMSGNGNRVFKEINYLKIFNNRYAWVLKSVPGRSKDQILRWAPAYYSQVKTRNEFGLWVWQYLLVKFIWWTFRVIIQNIFLK